MKRLISCRFNMDTACVECDIEGYHPRHTGASVDGLRISVAELTGQRRSVSSGSLGFFP